MLDKLLSVVGTILLLPTMLPYLLGYIIGENQADNTQKLTFLILALLNSISIWWLIYEVFIK